LSPLRARTPLSHGLMFWLLAGMGTATALPAFIVPPANALQRLRRLYHAECLSVEKLEHEIGQQRVLIEALRTDPQVNLRLAQRELRFVKNGEIPIRIPVPAATPPSLGFPQAESAVLLEPLWVQSLYPPRWAGLYRNQTVRNLVLVMSLALIVFAAAVYSPGPPSRAPGHANPSQRR
jgi:hypothetical protein